MTTHEAEWDAVGRGRQALRTAVAAEGVGALSDPHKLENVLHDLLPELPRESQLMVSAARLGVGRRLREQLDRHVDPASAVALTATELARAHPFDDVACRWVVREFALVMGLDVPEAASPELALPPPIPPPPAPATLEERAPPPAPATVETGAPPPHPPAPVLAFPPPPPDQYRAPVRPSSGEAPQPFVFAPEPIPQPERAGKPRPRRRLRGVVAVLVVVGAVAAGVIIVAQNHGGKTRSSPPTNQPTVATDAGHLVDLINQLRESKGLPALLIDGRLSSAASTEAAQLAPTGVADVSAVRPKVVNAVTPLFPSSDSVNVGFNLVPDAVTVDQAYQAELDSPDHLQNYTDPTWSYVGIGVAQKADRSLYILEIFVSVTGNAAGSPLS